MSLRSSAESAEFSFAFEQDQSKEAQTPRKSTASNAGNAHAEEALNARFGCRAVQDGSIPCKGAPQRLWDVAVCGSGIEEPRRLRKMQDASPARPEPAPWLQCEPTPKSDLHCIQIIPLQEARPGNTHPIPCQALCSQSGARTARQEMGTANRGKSTANLQFCRQQLKL